MEVGEGGGALGEHGEPLPPGGHLAGGPGADTGKRGLCWSQAAVGWPDGVGAGVTGLQGAGWPWGPGLGPAGVSGLQGPWTVLSNGCQTFCSLGTKLYNMSPWSGDRAAVGVGSVPAPQGPDSAERCACWWVTPSGWAPGFLILDSLTKAPLSAAQGALNDCLMPMVGGRGERPPRVGFLTQVGPQRVSGSIWFVPMCGPDYFQFFKMFILF